LKQVKLVTGVIVFLILIASLPCQAEEALNLANLFEEHGSVMLIIDPNTGAIERANKAAVAFYGYPAGELEKLRVQDINMLTPEEVVQEMELAVVEERNYFNFQHLLASGDIRHVEVYSHPVQWEGKTKLYSIIHDVTPRLEAEKALHRTAILIFILGIVTVIMTAIALLLHHKVKTKNKTLSERKKAEEALQLQASERAAVDAFTNSVSHDLQAPLRRIEGFSEALLEECPDELSELARDYLQRITRQIGSMKERTDALLKLSRIVSHDITREEVNLSALARAYLKRRCTVEPERQIETAIAPDLVASGDAHLLSIVIENLLHNAWKYTAETEKARIECGSILKDGLTIYFVKDNGAGFDQQRADEIFDPFKKLHSETEYPGIGIGLNLVYRIITRHGGKIWAEGEPGKGACFYFTLP